MRSKTPKRVLAAFFAFLFFIFQVSQVLAQSQAPSLD